MKKQLISMVLMAAMTVSMLTGCETADGKKTEAPSSENQAAAEVKAEDEGKASEGGEDYSYHWKLATTESSDYYMTQLSQEFLDIVEEKTGGKVTGEVFASGQLGGLVDALEGLEMGNIDIVMDGVSSLSAVDDIFNVWCLPFLYDNKEHQYRFWDNHFDEVSDMVAEQSGFRLVSVIDGMNRELASTVPVESMADLKGLKIRVPNIPGYVRIWECLGAAPIPMSLSEVYTSIQTGVVQGQENDIALTLSLKFYEVAPYCVMTDHVAYEGSFYFNEEEYQSYPDELKQIIQEAGEEIKLKSRNMIKEQEMECMKQIEDMGVTICRPDLEEFKKAPAVMYDEYDMCAPIIELVDKARNE